MVREFAPFLIAADIDVVRWKTSFPSNATPFSDREFLFGAAANGRSGTVRRGDDSKQRRGRMAMPGERSGPGRGLLRKGLAMVVLSALVLAACGDDDSDDSADDDAADTTSQPTSTIALGAPDDPTFQLYEAVMEAYGQDVQDVENATAMGGYVAMASLLTSLEEISGEITVESIIDTIKSMPEAELPGGGGMTYQCGGSAAPELPAVCTNQSLRTQLDGEGQPTTYEVVDSTELVSEE
jgi:hypothetical protein